MNAVTVTLATVIVHAMDAVEYTVDHAEVHPTITYPVYSVHVAILLRGQSGDWSPRESSSL